MNVGLGLLSYNTTLRSIHHAFMTFRKNSARSHKSSCGQRAGQGSVEANLHKRAIRSCFGYFAAAPSHLEARSSLADMSSSSKSSKVVAGLKSSLKAKSPQQIKVIADACDNDFELQLLVLKTITDYQNTKLLTDAQSLSLQLAEDKNKKKQHKDEPAEKDWSIAPTGVLRRGLLYYKHLGPELIFSAFAFIEPDIRECGSLKALPILRSRGQELLSFAFDVNCDDDCPDRVSVDEKSGLWPRLLSKYNEGGNRLKTIMAPLKNNAIDWSSHGFFEISLENTTSTSKVIVKNRVTNTTSEIPSAIVGKNAQVFNNCVVHNNFSQLSAFVDTDDGRIPLGSYFASKRRHLKRSVSGTTGIVMPQGLLKKIKLGRVYMGDGAGDDKRPSGPSGESGDSMAVAAAGSSMASRDDTPAAPKGALADEINQGVHPPEMTD